MFDDSGLRGLLATKSKHSAPSVEPSSDGADAVSVRSGATETKHKRKGGAGKKGSHTLFSTGILQQARKKNNEYFGGDSTVVSAGDEPEEDSNET
jgi:hypothetical protein